MAGTGTQTIENYVDGIVKHLRDLDYKMLVQVYDTLQKMRFSMKIRHELNYWKVLQCLGEVAIDRFIKVLVQNERTSCKCHIYSNLFSIVQLLNETLVNVSIIKRCLCYKEEIVPVMFKALRQKEDPVLVLQILILMYRCLIVGKSDIVELYMKEKLLGDCQQQIRCRMPIYSRKSVITVLYCVKLMFSMAVLGDPKTRRIVKNSPALRAHGEYASVLRRENVNNDVTFAILDYHQDIKDIVTNEDEAKDTARNWKPKLKLKDDLDQDDDDDLFFCSSPTCRKQALESFHFRYCGACRLSRYCCENCQREHWKNGHKEKCLQRYKDIDDIS